jgi:general L-amino acid transport system substrate-binding protein
MGPLYLVIGMRKHLFPLLLLVFAGAVASAQASTLEAVKQRGELRCGINGDLPGFSARNAGDSWAGFDVDFCRAVAAAVLGDADQVSFVATSPEDRIARLAAGEYDVLARNTTWTLHRDAGSGVHFVGVSYYDGQGFMANDASGLRSALELDGKRVCVLKGTTSALNVRDYFTTHRMKLSLNELDDQAQALEAYGNGQCDVLTSDMSQLFSLRTRLAQPADHRILPELISKEPLSPAVRSDDMSWFNIVRWTLFALVEAEEMNIDAANVGRIRDNAKRPEFRRLLGVEGDLGERLGLANDWAYQVIRQVGSYAEIFDRNLGNGSALKMHRGINALWLDGGLLFSPPMR